MYVFRGASSAVQRLPVGMRIAKKGFEGFQFPGAQHPAQGNRPRNLLFRGLRLINFPGLLSRGGLYLCPLPGIAFRAV